MHHLLRFLLLTLCLCGVSVIGAPTSENGLALATPRGLSSAVVPAALIERATGEGAVTATTDKSSSASKKPLSSKITKKKKKSKSKISTKAKIIIIIIVVIFVLCVLAFVFFMAWRQKRKQKKYDMNAPVGGYQGPPMQQQQPGY